MQYGGRGSMLRAARRRCDWFAYCLDVCFPPYASLRVFAEADRSGLLLIRNVI
jgi:hypothetical protein